MQGTKKLNAVLCQTSPVLKKKQQNIARFDKLMQNYSQEDNIDIVVFPELSFTGYNFKNQQDIAPMAVRFGQGVEFEYGKVLAKRLRAYVLIGYVQRQEKNGQVRMYNSAAVIDRQGVAFFNTRKVHLYYAEELWGYQGQQFGSFVMTNTEGVAIKCSVGICMDINPKKFTSGLYQFADYVKKQQSEVILFATNWTDDQVQNKEKDIETYNYWLQRLRPLLKPAYTKNVLFLAADRVGSQFAHYINQKGSFLGASCVLSINPHQLLAKLDRKSQKTLFARLTIK